MSVQTTLGYSIRCDFPGCGITTGDIGEYGAYNTLEDAIDDWVDASDGVFTEQGATCSEHSTWTGDGERVSMPPTLDSMFAVATARVDELIAARARFASYRVDMLVDMAQVRADKWLEFRRVAGWGWVA